MKFAPRRSRTVIFRSVFPRIVIPTVVALASVVAAHTAQAQLKPGEKPRLAITKIVATPSVAAQAQAEGTANILDQILDGSNGQLLNAMHQTRKFEIVARQDLEAILKEQDLANSGMVDPGDPQTARAFQLAGARYVATITVDSFQDIMASTTFEGQFGTSAAEKRTIQIQMLAKIFDTTKGTLLESTNVPLEMEMMDEVLPGVSQQGRKTNALTGMMTELLARTAAQTITDVILPPKVIAYTMGMITFNRTEGGGVEAGQIWEIFAPGQELIDPDTGESLGSEEIHIGWAQVTEAGPKFSKAQAIEDFGINRGSLLRHRPEGLPAGVDPNARANGSASANPGGNTPVSRVAYGTASPAAGEPAPPLRNRPAPAPIQEGAAVGAQPLRLALFVRDASPDVPDQKVRVLEDYLTATLSAQAVEVIARSVVLNSVSRMAKEGPNEGTGDPMNTMAERLLSDQTSASALARNLGATGFLIASITSYTTDTRNFSDPDLGVERVTVFHTVDLSWSIQDGATGGTIASDLVQARTGMQQSKTLTQEYNPIDQLLREGAMEIATGVHQAIQSGAMRTPVAEAGEVNVKISVALADLSVPEIREVDGSWTITANRYDLQPMACDIMIDGFLAGTAPGVVSMTPGPHRLRVERPMLSPVDRFIVAREGLDLVIPMQFSPEGRREWMEQTAFFESLKNGEVIRQATMEKARAFATFLRKSRFNFDTAQVRNLAIGQPVLWAQLLDG